MKENNLEKFGEFFHVPPHIVTFVPELLSEIWALGSLPGLIVEWFQELSLSPNTKVLDLACGKGAVAIALARTLQFEITGIDYFKPFILEAQKKAVELNVDKLCHFKHGDITNVENQMDNFDIVSMTAVGNVFGDTKQTVSRLRDMIKNDGYILIDDGYLSSNNKINHPDYKDCKNNDETISQLTAMGDKIINEKILTIDEITMQNRMNTERIEKKVITLSKKHPEYRQDFEHYLQWEKDECKILETDFTSAVWLLQKV